MTALLPSSVCKSLDVKLHENEKKESNVINTHVNDSLTNCSSSTPFGRNGSLNINLSQMELSIDPVRSVYWQYLRPTIRPSFTMELLGDMKRSLNILNDLYVGDGHSTPEIRWVVMASALPGIFNLGGDLPLFVDLIKERNRDALLAYAIACIDVQYPRSVNLDRPFVSISLVQGDALGGGFEAALADDLIIAEKGAKFGLPEILFNLFPGMGALTFLTRKVGRARAEDLVFSGKIYTAEEMRDLGVVDIVVEDGCGQSAVYDFIDTVGRSYAARSAVYRARQAIHPITREELVQITESWVDAALTLDPIDLRKMERLATAQDRRWSQLSTQMAGQDRSAWSQVQEKSSA
jgi:DSF synthase